MNRPVIGLRWSSAPRIITARRPYGLLSVDHADQVDPSEVLLASQSGSAALSDQVKNLDCRAGRVARKGKITDLELRQVRAKLRALIG
jgi:mRNA-degrading endonuclease toxin of MazEF toxin-antitoxin module